jgi:hypothetical protein
MRAGVARIMIANAIAGDDFAADHFDQLGARVAAV